MALTLGACGVDETFVPIENLTPGSGAAGPTELAAGAAGEEGNAGNAGEGGDTGDADPEDSLPAPALADEILVEGVQVPLKPAFSPDLWRYAIQAGDPPEPVAVTVTADPEVEIWVDGEAAESGVALELDEAEPGSEIEIVVRNSLDEENQYTLVYLPYDFPNLTITTNEPGASTDPIYVAPRGSGRYFIAKLDAHGVPLFYDKQPDNCADFKKNPTGQYSYALENDDSNWEHIVLDEDFEEVTRVTTVGLDDTDVHEFHILPNGNYIVLAYERTTRDLTEFGKGSEEVVVDAILQELSPEREVLFEWNSWDHFSYGDSIYHKNSADYSHINSVFVDTDGNWILSSRAQAQVLKIDRSTGEVLWRLGGKTNEFRFIDDPYQGLCGQHTATRVENGNLLLFDNGQSCWPEVAERGELTRIVEYEIDEVEKTARLVFSFDREGAYTTSQGSAQRLPNGNTLIGWGLGFRALATEVDPDGNIVFEIEGRMPTNFANSYRVYRFPD